MNHVCQDCDHKFFDAGQSQDSISPAAQCPNCHSYRTQPAGIPDESNEMLHGLQSMPTSTEDDMSGNPLKEGILADNGWKSRQVRDESFAASVRRSDFPTLFEAPEFETTQLVTPPDLYRHGMESEATHRAGVQLPHGITDNLHAALGNLQAWVENPYENGELRPYYNKYWKVIRPSFMKPGALQIGVADPTMAEIINHVAQTDDLTPLYEYRGKNSHTKTAFWAALAAPFAGLLGGGLSEAAGAGLASGVAEVGGASAVGTGGAAAGGAAAGGVGGAAAGGAAAADGLASAATTGGVMSPVIRGAEWQLGNQAVKRIAPVLGLGDDVVGMGGGGAGGGPGGSINDSSFYSRLAGDENNAFPNAHDEIPKHEDGDHKQQDDSNNHEWQRDISVNGVGGAEHSPSFDPAGPGFQRFVMMLPLLLQYLQSGEDGSQDPLIQALHTSLEQEIPGYLDHADPEAGQRLIMLVEPHLKGGQAEPEKNDSTHADENAGGKHESRVASLSGTAASFLPDLIVDPPALRGLSAMYPHRPSEIPSGVISGPLYAEDEALDSSSWPKSEVETCPYCGHYGKSALGLCGGCGREIYSNGQAQLQARDYEHHVAADTQGPHTPEQIQAVQKWLMGHGSEIGLEGDELIQTVLSVPTNPLDFADVLANIQNAESPPESPDAGGMSAQPPMPPMEQAPPGATMPVPGMDQQMMSAVQRYAADSIADKCSECGSHTTELLSDEDGTSRCHACHTIFKTKGIADKVHPGQTTASTWNVDEDLRKEADAEAVTDSADTEPVEGVPIADQTHRRDLRAEQDSGHTWTDEDGNPLKVGQEYEMYSEKYDIPDLVRIEAVKPHALVYTLTGEFGLEHSTELTKEEANIERVSFRSTVQDGEVDQGDSFEENNDDNTAYTGEPEHRDMSAPSGLVAARVIASGITDQGNPKLAWLKAGMSHMAGASYTAMEQRALIEEHGSARNADLLQLAGTHYIDADEDHFLFGY